MPIQIESSLTFHQAPNRERAPIIGIDLGTTNSLVAIVKDGKPEVLNSREGKHLVPSVVSFLNGEPVVGYQAKKLKVRDAHLTVFSVKRLLGRGFEDLESIKSTFPYEVIPGEDSGDGKAGMARVRVGEHAYTAIEISAMILRELKLSAEKALGCAVDRAVITVPAYFNDAQRQATRTAGRIAGLDVLRIINEPTAASLAYGLDQKKQGLIAVYDLGGGTFDVSILKLQNGIFEVLATQGDTALGGDDLDQVIVKTAAQEIQERWNTDIYSNIQLHAAVLEAAEAAKIILSAQPETAFDILLPSGSTYHRKWTLDEFTILARPILERTRLPCMKALKDAGLDASQLSDVVLVGGPTRLKIVQAFAEEIFGRVPNTSMHPDEVVAEGAAIQADVLAGNNQDVLLLDVVPLSLGLETYGGVMSPVIHRNTKIPTVAKETFTTFVDGQTVVDIHVLQGERERVADNRSLARFKLKGIQPLPAGMSRIEVSFLIDADGILQVSAKDLKTGKEQSLEVRPSYGLTDLEVERMLMASHENAETDVAYRNLVEARNEAEPVLRAVEKNLTQAYRLLPPPDVKVIENAIERLKEALKQDKTEEIRLASRRLSDSTVRLAEVIIKDSIEKLTV